MTQKKMLALLKTITGKTSRPASRKAAGKKLIRALRSENWSNYFAFRRALASELEAGTKRIGKTLRNRKIKLVRKAEQQR
jgi:hypothetical protein